MATKIEPQHDPVTRECTAFTLGQEWFLADRPLLTMPLLDPFRTAMFRAGYVQELEDCVEATNA